MHKDKNNKPYHSHYDGKFPSDRLCRLDPFTISSCYNFRERAGSVRVLKEANVTKGYVNKTLMHDLVLELFLPESDRLSSAMVVI